MKEKKDINWLVSEHKKKSFRVVFDSLNVGMIKKKIDEEKHAGQDTTLLERRVKGMNASIKKLMSSIKKLDKEIRSSTRLQDGNLVRVTAVSVMSSEFGNSLFLPESVKKNVFVYVIEKEKFF